MRAAISSVSGGLVAAGLCGMLASRSALGRVFTWTNGTGGSWNTGSNWSPIGVPDGAGKSAVFDLAGTFMINLSGGPSPDSVQLLSTGATAAGSNFTSLRFAASAPLSGTGSVRLNASGNLSTAYIETVGAGEVLHQSPHKILGTGRITAKMTNASQVIADVAGSLLEITGPMTQTGAGELRAAPGIIGLGSGAALSGGSINGSGAGSWQVTGDPTISGVMININGVVKNSAILRLLAGGPVNHAGMSVNDGLGLNFTRIRVDEACTVNGSGTINLRTASNLDTAYIESLSDTAILTQKPFHTMPQDCPSDLNFDGVVDDSDFTIWIVAYNQLLCS
ncbi:MAG: hypothetical protein ACREJD_02215 [Phycisphaerales bacterium]